MMGYLASDYNFVTLRKKTKNADIVSFLTENERAESCPEIF